MRAEFQAVVSGWTLTSDVEDLGEYLEATGALHRHSGRPAGGRRGANHRHDGRVPNRKGNSARRL